jgi:T5SS/PEP-CTERM-associated repeat protein
VFRSNASRYLLVVWLVAGAGELFAAVTTVGAVPNAPPAGGGAVVGAFTIGDGAFGSVTVNAGTAITSTGGATLGNLVDGIGVVSLNGFGSDWTLNNAASDLTLGDEGVGQITVANLARVTVPDDTLVGVLSTGSGKLIVTGLGSVYDNGDDFAVGVSGIGVVDVLAGGVVVSDVLTLGDLASGQGSVTVSGELSRWTVTNTVVGDAGDGSLTVENGGRFTSSTSIAVGNLSESVGAVDISGAGTLVSAPSLTVGGSGSGRFIVRDGGRFVSTGTVNVAQDAASVGELVVSGAGSRFSTSGATTLGVGEGKITLADGGVYFTTGLFTVNSQSILQLAGGRLEVTPAANPSVSISGQVRGSGVIDTAGVSLSSAGGRLIVGSGDNMKLTGILVNSGFVDLNGGELEVTSSITNNGDIDARNGAVLRAGSSGIDNNATRQLAITGGAVDVYGAVDNNSGAEIAVVGGSTAVFHDAVTNNGTIFVSASSEIVLLENLSFVPSSSLSIQLASSALQDPTEEFGLMGISGAASIAGGIAVSLAAGFTPTLGDTFEVLTASGGRSGTFATESLPTLGGGLALDVQYTANSVVLAVVSTAIPGDYNGNGVVDAADYTRWRDTLGTSTTLPGDTTPGTVTAADYTVWKNNFGATASAASAAAVPEPSTICLAALLLASASVANRRKCHSPD